MPIRRAGKASGVQPGWRQGRLGPPAADEPPPSNSSPRPPTTEFQRPRPITHYGGYGSGYQGIYGSGHGEGDGHCDLYFAAHGGWCPTVTVTGAPIGAP